MTDNDYLLGISLSIGVCLLGLCLLLKALRENGPSLGLPFAYLCILLINHVPGAAVPLMATSYSHLPEVALGIKYTAISSICFAIGAWYARWRTQEQRLAPALPSSAEVPDDTDRGFWIYCVGMGWLVSFVLSPLANLPSVGAVVYYAGAIWMLGNLLGLRWAVRAKKTAWTFFWLGCLTVYPLLILFRAGFLGYGVTAVVIVLSALGVAAKGYWRVLIAIALMIYLGLSLFANYFQGRDYLRQILWSDAPVSTRIIAAGRVISESKAFDSSDELVLAGLDMRLNQNYFIGVAAQNLENGQVEYLNGKSISDAVLAVIPRALWPGKTVTAGSPDIVMAMTGLYLSTWTSWGIGNVMEFYINFGVPGLIVGFLFLGWMIGRLDHRAALYAGRRDYGMALVFFLPGVAAVQPLGSLVELTGGCASAWIAGHCWAWIYNNWWGHKAGQKALETAPPTVS